VAPAATIAEPAHRSATALGRRPTPPQATPSATVPSSGTVEILGSGLFMGGNGSLQIGSRYLLAKVGPKLHLLGPIHISPSAIAARVTLADAEATVLEDRLVITGRAGSDLSLVFSGVVTEPGLDLEEQLVAPTTPRAVAT
jgi:hypothetical protein